MVDQAKPKQKSASVPKQKLPNKRRVISGKKILEHARSQSKLTNSQKNKIKRRALSNRKVVPKSRFVGRLTLLLPDLASYV